MRSPLRSRAQVEGTQGFLPQPGKDLERPSSTFSDPMDCSLLGSSIHGIFQARALEWGGIFLAFSKELSLNGAKEKESVSLPLHLHY